MKQIHLVRSGKYVTKQGGGTTDCGSINKAKKVSREHAIVHGINSVTVI